MALMPIAGSSRTILQMPPSHLVLQFVLLAGMCVVFAALAWSHRPILSFSAALCAGFCFGNTIVWRGRRYYLYIYIRTVVSNYEREVLTLIRNLILITTIVLRVASSETVSFLVIDDTGKSLSGWKVTKFK